MIRTAIKHYVPPLNIYLFAIFAITVILYGCTEEQWDRESQQVLDSLDSALSDHDRLIAEKERKIESIKSLSSGLSATELYNLYDRLYTEYFSFNFDSAMHYAYLKRAAAIESNDRIKAAESALQIARAGLAIGKEAEAISIINSVSSDTADIKVKTMYHDVMDAYGEMKLAGSDRLPHLLSLRNLLEEGSARWFFNECNLLMALGKDKEAIMLIANNDSIISTSSRNLGIARFLSGRIKLQQGDTIEAIRDLAISARNDIVSPVRDYRSLYELANLLFQKGDIARAYRYINFAIEDNNASNVVDNIIATNNIIPAIAKANEARNIQQNKAKTKLLLSLAVLSLLLTGAFVWVARSRATASKAKKKAEELNRKLEASNMELSSLNLTLNESNGIKDAYLVQYLNSCSYYIDCLDRFRTSIKAAARTKGLQAVNNLLDSDQAIEKELKIFYKNFDSTFNILFPGFVIGINRLLNNDRQLEANSDGSMTTELRVLALIRLGITDSGQIASFLRRSVSTIYNIRVKLRNAAVVKRDSFEDEIKKIS